MKTRFCAYLSTFMLAVAAAGVHASTFSSEALDNATVQPAGPRTGANGKAFFNMEGSTAGGTSFKSFGVADFNFGAIGTVSGVSNITLSLTESNAAFTAPGNISVYLTTNTASNIIQPGDPSQVKYQDSVNGAAAVDPALFPLSTVLGTFAFPTTGNINNGQVDTIPLTLDGPATTAFLNALNSGATIRLVVTPDDGTVAATYAGFSNATVAGPTLSFSAVTVPEPSSLALCGIFVGALMMARKRRRTS